MAKTMVRSWEKPGSESSLSRVVEAVGEATDGAEPERRRFTAGFSVEISAN